MFFCLLVAWHAYRNSSKGPGCLRKERMRLYRVFADKQGFSHELEAKKRKTERLVKIVKRSKVVWNKNFSCSFEWIYLGGGGGGTPGGALIARGGDEFMVLAVVLETPGGGLTLPVGGFDDVAARSLVDLVSCDGGFTTFLVNITLTTMTTTTTIMPTAITM